MSTEITKKDSRAPYVRRPCSRCGRPLGYVTADPCGRCRKRDRMRDAETPGAGVINRS